MLDIQPRETSSSSGKSADEVACELAEAILEDLPPLLDTEEHAKGLFTPNSKGLLHSLSTVLLQEIERFNRLLAKMGVTLELLKKAIHGIVLMSPELDLMYGALTKNVVPPNWTEVAYPSLKPLASWIKDLKERVDFMRDWLLHGQPKSFWLSGFFFPHGFMTGTLQTFARKHTRAIDLLFFKFTVLPTAGVEELAKGPQDGIYVHGLFIEGARWSYEAKCIEEQLPGEMTYAMPIIHFLPSDGSEPPPNKKKKTEEKEEDSEEDYETYQCPCYKTSVRAGVLSTTGQSTNFILAVDLPSAHPPEHWTLCGAALLTMLND